MRPPRIVGGVVAASIMALGAIVGAPVASAANGNADYVSFGDSFTTNVPAQDFYQTQIDKLLAENPVEAACSNHDGNYPRIAAAARGYSLADYSCNGSTVTEVLPESVGAAIRSGDLGPGTHEVSIMIGYGHEWNDTDTDFGGLYMKCVLSSCPTGADATDGLNGEAFSKAIEYPISLIRAYAPNARIHLLSYPTGTDNDQMCLPNPVVPYYPANTRGWVDYELNMAYSIWQTAVKYQVNFVDVREFSLGHGPCSTDPWMNGIIFSEPAAMPMHTTTRGHQAIGEYLASRF